VNNPTLVLSCGRQARKSRHRRITKQRRCERLAATASYLCGNFSVTSCFNIQNPTSIEKGSLGHAYTFRIHTGNGDINTAFGLLLPRMISVHAERCFGTPALLFYRCAAPAKLPIKRVSQEYMVSPGGDGSQRPGEQARGTSGLSSKRVDSGKEATEVDLLTLSSTGRTREAACRSQFT